MTPTRKVSAGALAGALSVILVWALGEFAHLTITPEIASSLTVVLTFIVSWLVPSLPDE